MVKIKIPSRELSTWIFAFGALVSGQVAIFVRAGWTLTEVYCDTIVQLQVSILGGQIS